MKNFPTVDLKNDHFIDTITDIGFGKVDGKQIKQLGNNSKRIN